LEIPFASNYIAVQQKLEETRENASQLKALKRKVNEVKHTQVGTPRKIVGTEGNIKVLLPEYQVYKCFIILNNCAIQNSKL
jgi:hypothetical protein